MTVPVADRLHLNAEQRTALNLMGDGPLRLVAGPGTGKTTTVVAMYLRLLEEVGLRPSQVLLLTFANNAASDLKRRIDALHNTSYDEAWVSTFHSFATRILTTHGHLRGIVPFRLMNGFEEKVLMRRVLTQMSGLEVLGPLQTSEALVQDALWFIGVLKQNLVRSDDFSRYSRVSNNAKMRDLAAIYTAYWAEQGSRHLWDFRDVIAQCQLLLARNDALREELSTKFQHVIVDEYQDVDAAQVKLIAQLVEHHHPHPRLAVVGDPNQAIYSFRGTLPAFLDEKWQFGGTRVELRQNYRSYGSILRASDRLLDRYGLGPAGLAPDRGNADVPVLHLEHEQNATDEATAVVRQIAELIARDDAPSPRYAAGDIAIVLRSVRRHGRQFEEALRAAGIPHEVGASPNFASSDVVRFAVHALGALAHPDDDTFLMRVVESPFASVPAADAHRLLAEAERRRRAATEALRTTSLLTVLKHTCFLLRDADPSRWPLPWSNTEPPLSPEDRTDLEQEQAAADALEWSSREPTETKRRTAGFFDLLSDDGCDAIHGFTWRWARLRSSAGQVAVDLLLYRVFDELGVMRLLMSPATSDSRRDELLGPLRMLFRAVGDYVEFQTLLTDHPPSLAETVTALEQLLPEYIDELAAADQPEQGVVRILTAHASKGLEFPVVFMPAMASQHFPVVARARTPLLEKHEQKWLEKTLVDFAPPWPATDEEFLREEARLGYVAATRAQDMLFLSWADTYEKEEIGAPSAFLEPLAGDAPLGEYTELQRDPALGSGRDAPDERDAAAFTGWEAWSEPVVFTSESYDSSSSISKFLACPRQYYYSKTLGLRTESGVAAARGSAFHAALQQFHAPENERRWRHDAALAATFYAECCGTAIEAHLRTVDGELDRRVERGSLRRLFANYYKSEIEGHESPATAATEARFTWHPLRDVTIRGYIDRIIVVDEGGHEIVDYKTGKSGKTTGELSDDLGITSDIPHDFQLLIYFFGSREGEVGGVPTVDPHVVGLWYPSNLMKGDQIRKTRIIADDRETPKNGPLHLNDDQLEEARARILTTLEEIHVGDFAPRPRHDGYTCLAAWGKGCDYAWVCPGRIEEPEAYEAE